MGEVYRARDSKLGRDVAIKVLPASFTANPERLARFEREATITAPTATITVVTGATIIGETMTMEASASSCRSSAASML